MGLLYVWLFHPQSRVKIRTDEDMRLLGKRMCGIGLLHLGLCEQDPKISELQEILQIISLSTHCTGEEIETRGNTVFINSALKAGWGHLAHLGCFPYPKLEDSLLQSPLAPGFIMLKIAHLAHHFSKELSKCFHKLDLIPFSSQPCK